MVAFFMKWSDKTSFPCLGKTPADREESNNSSIGSIRYLQHLWVARTTLSSTVLSLNDFILECHYPWFMKFALFLLITFISKRLVVWITKHFSIFGYWLGRGWGVGRSAPTYIFSQSVLLVINNFNYRFELLVERRVCGRSASTNTFLTVSSINLNYHFGFCGGCGGRSASTYFFSQPVLLAMNNSHIG